MSDEYADLREIQESITSRLREEILADIRRIDDEVEQFQTQHVAALEANPPLHTELFDLQDLTRSLETLMSYLDFDTDPQARSSAGFSAVSVIGLLHTSSSRLKTMAAGVQAPGGLGGAPQSPGAQALAGALPSLTNRITNWLQQGSNNLWTLLGQLLNVANWAIGGTVNVNPFGLGGSVTVQITFEP